MKYHKSSWFTLFALKEHPEYTRTEMCFPAGCNHGVPALDWGSHLGTFTKKGNKLKCSRIHLKFYVEFNYEEHGASFHILNKAFFLELYS